MHEIIKIPIQEILIWRPMGQTIKEAVIKMALKQVNNKKDWGGYDMENPHIMARDSFIEVHFFKKTGRSSVVRAES